MTDPVFALFDDLDARPGQPSSRLYTGFAREHRCADPGALDAIWRAVEDDQRAGLHAVVLADYEWGDRLQRGAAAGGGESALRVLLFATLQHLSAQAADAWLQAQDEGRDTPSPAGVLDLRASVDRAAFGEAIARIQDAIRRGETYQVNYTYRLDGRMHGSAVALYRRLRAAQPVPYGAFIALPVRAGQPLHVLSCSPELFMRHERGLLTARPMKGTAPRGGDAGRDAATARWLAADPKNRAENVMIVDLLRNDLGRVARIGSVTVPALFSVEPHGTVLQMTSTVQAELAPGTGFADLLRATFPCGSITGAPKHHTMSLIAGLETTPRGLYTGAIGWVDAPPAGATGGAGCGDFCLSVAIRTVVLDDIDADGLCNARLGVGAGIVIDSEPEAEFEECRLKARFLTALDPGFELFETLLAPPGEGLRYLSQHLQRMAGSAQDLGFAFDAARADQRLREHVQSLPTDAAHRVRLALAHDGRLSITSERLAPLPEQPVRLILAPHPVARPALLARHKTTLRQDYDAGVRAAQACGAFDSLFFSPDGRLTEGGRTNVFVKLGGRWWTPPVSDGVLPGVMRAVVLQDPQWQVGERSIHRDELAGAQGWMVCSALRGTLMARLQAPAPAQDGLRGRSQ
jgi:para-aminobenzoate synthetase/4-amino-4-deoxychorismate lyase